MNFTYDKQMRSKPYIRYVFLISLMIVVILILGYLSQDLSLLFTSLLASLKSSITITIIISVCVVLFMGSKILKSMKRYFNLSEKLIPGWETSLDEVIEKISNNESNSSFEEIESQNKEEKSKEEKSKEWKRAVSIMMTAVTPVNKSSDEKPDEVIKPILEICPEDAREYLRRSWNSFFENTFLYTNESGKSRRYSAKSAWILFDERFFDSAFQYRVSFISIQRSFVKMAPGLMTSLGMLGTFLGISSGLGDLANFETLGSEEITQSMGRVIVGLTSAFWTSIVGLLGAMVFSIKATFVQSNVDRITARLVNGIEKVLPPFNPERAQRDTAQALKSIREFLDGGNPNNKATLYHLLEVSNKNQETMHQTLQGIQFNSLNYLSQFELFVSSFSDQQKNAIISLKNIEKNQTILSSQLFNMIDIFQNSIVKEIKSIQNQNQSYFFETIKIITNVNRNQEIYCQIIKNIELNLVSSTSQIGVMIEQIREEIIESRSHLQTISNDLYDNLSKSIHDSMGTFLSDQLTSILSLAKDQSNAIATTVLQESKNLISTIVDQIQETLKKSFADLSNQVDIFASQFHKTTNHLDITVQALDATTDKQKNVAENLTEIAEHIGQRLDQVLSQWNNHQYSYTEQYQRAINLLSLSTDKIVTVHDALDRSLNQLEETDQKRFLRIQEQIDVWKQTMSGSYHEFLNQWAVVIKDFKQHMSNISEQQLVHIQETFKRLEIEINSHQDALKLLNINTKSINNAVEDSIILFSQSANLLTQSNKNLNETLNTSGDFLQNASKDLNSVLKATQSWIADTNVALESFSEGISKSLDGTLTRYDESLAGAVQHFLQSISEFSYIATQLSTIAKELRDQAITEQKIQ